jgi:hypothetical protein
MSWHYGILCCCAACATCQAVPAFAADVRAQAVKLWESGQRAMGAGHYDEAIRCYKQCLTIDPGYRRSHLSLAAAYLEKRDEIDACTHLGAYLDAYPENLSIRARYAELLARLRRLKDARTQFETYVADVQELPEPPAQTLVPCHTRLMEIAEARNDAYGEHLHRGIALLLLARRREQLQPSEGQLPAEGLLCKAATELSLANLKRPEEARPCWYLYLAWSQLGQRQLAVCRLIQADRAAPFTYLTPAEQRNLRLACQVCRSDPLR